MSSARIAWPRTPELRAAQKSDDRTWLIVLALSAIVLSLPRLILGPYSAVGILGDIGDYSVPYMMASGDGFFANQWIGEAPMGGALYSLGYFSPAQQLLYSVLPGWLAHGINWLIMTLVAGLSTFLAARTVIGLAPIPAVFAGLLNAVAVANGNFGYSVIAFMPLVLLTTYQFSLHPKLKFALAIICASVALAAWVPAKFLVLFPAIVVLVGTLCLARNSLWLRLVAAMIAIIVIYLLRGGDLAEFVFATAHSDRSLTVGAQPFMTLLQRGLEYGIEYIDPTLILKFTPLPQTNLISAGFLLSVVALFLCRKSDPFRRLALAVFVLLALQIVFPLFWQFVLFDLVEQPGVYFHPKLWRPVVPLLFLGAGCGIAGTILKASPAMTARWSARRARWAAIAPIIILMTAGLSQSIGYGAVSWLADGNFRALYRDSTITTVAETINAGASPSRAAIVDRPNAVLAPYGIATPFGRRDWISRRYALLLEAAGLVETRSGTGIEFTTLYHQRLMLPSALLPSDGSASAVLNFLALGSVEYLVARNSLDRPYLKELVPPQMTAWESLSTLERIRRSATANFSGPSLLSAYRFPGALPRVRAATTIIVVTNARTAADRILAFPVDKLPGVAVVEAGTRVPGITSAPERMSVLYDDRTGYEIKVSAASSALLIVSEIFDKGWRYEINGEAAEPVPVNAAFVGLPVPAGRHSLKLSRSDR